MMTVKYFAGCLKDDEGNTYTFQLFSFVCGITTPPTKGDSLMHTDGSSSLIKMEIVLGKQ
jgi:hypothetical protein